ncbi:MAG: hypothetical protein PUF80_06985 [Firmicutes bacterium]|nr:hypothetical protein [Bacillota bacterium]
MLRRFFSQAWLYQKARTAAFDWREFLFFDTGYPIITMVFYCLLAACSFRTTELTHWVVGNSFLMCVNTCIFGLGSLFRSERYSGRLRSIIASPCNLLSVVLSYGFSRPCWQSGLWCWALLSVPCCLELISAE